MRPGRNKAGRGCRLLALSADSPKVCFSLSRSRAGRNPPCCAASASSASSLLSPEFTYSPGSVFNPVPTLPSAPRSRERSRAERGRPCSRPAASFGGGRNNLGFLFPNSYLKGEEGERRNELLIAAKPSLFSEAV